MIPPTLALTKKLFFQIDLVFMAFCLNPSSISLPSFRTPFCVSRTTHVSKSGLSAGILKIKKGACQEIGILRLSCYRSCGFNSSLVQKRRHLWVGEGDKRMNVFEQEGLVDGDVELRAVEDGLEATLNRLSKWLVSCTLWALVILRHDGEAMWILLGSLLNTILSVVLKRVLNQDRPVSTLKSDPGMPSSHAQSIFFISSYVIVSMMELLGVNVLTLLLSSLVFALASYLAWLRILQKDHTVSQVLVGAIFGSGFSVFWMWLWNAVIHEAFISFLLVRVCVAGIAFALLLYVIRLWLRDDN